MTNQEQSQRLQVGQIMNQPGKALRYAYGFCNQSHQSKSCITAEKSSCFKTKEGATANRVKEDSKESRDSSNGKHSRQSVTVSSEETLQTAPEVLVACELEGPGIAGLLLVFEI